MRGEVRRFFRLLTGGTGRQLEVASDLMAEASETREAARVIDPRREIEYTPYEKAAYMRGKAAGTYLAVEALPREEE